MALNLFDQFVQNLVRSGLASAEDLQGLLDGLPSGQPAADAQTLSDRLVARGKLTSFQAEAIREGHADQLVLGNYVILEKLGAGGMGAVFKARHRRMKRIVAVKILPRETRHSPDDFERFQREVEAVASLSHPNIVTAYDADDSALGQFLVMEYVEGSDLDAIVRKRGPLPLPEAIDAFLQSARALEYVHNQGLIHRDIKPANLLCDMRGTIKVADLGLARFSKGLGEHATDTGLTQAGTVFGTVDYMSPEQALDSTLADHRSDIYSLGCSLYYLLTGHVVYRAQTIMGKLLAHREQPIPSLCAARADVPEALNNIYVRMLAKKPDDRYASLTDVVRDLEACGVAGGIQAKAARALPAAEPRKLAELSVMIVEPSRAQSLLMSGLVRKVGVGEVKSQADGRSALEALRQAPPDCVLCTLHLPDMTGPELLQRLRAEPALANTAFMLVSSEFDHRALDSLRPAGPLAVLPKPFDAEQVKRALGFTIPGLVMASPPPPRDTLRALVVSEGLEAPDQVRTVLSAVGLSHIEIIATLDQSDSLLKQQQFDLAVVRYQADEPMSVRRTHPVLMVAAPARLAAVRQEGLLVLDDEPFERDVVDRILTRALGRA